MLKFLKDIKQLKEDVERLNYMIDCEVVTDGKLGRLQDLVCKHRNWEDMGTASSWRVVECKNCGKRTRLSCKHGGSVACEECVKDFIEEAGK